MRNKGKKLRGMTLIEVIIAMFVLTVISLLMVQMGSVTKSIMFQTNHLNNKTDAEAPIVNVRDESALKDATTGDFKEVTQKDAQGNEVLDADGNPVKIAVEQDLTFTVGEKQADGSVSDKYGEFNGKCYNAAAAADESDLNTNTNMNGNLEFYKVSPSTP